MARIRAIADLVPCSCPSENRRFRRKHPAALFKKNKVQIGYGSIDCQPAGSLVLRHFVLRAFLTVVSCFGSSQPPASPGPGGGGESLLFQQQ
jgi:hypothetical protein